jgi:PAS domain S-box-containing protein
MKSVRSLSVKAAINAPAVRAEASTTTTGAGDGAGDMQGGPDAIIEFQRQETLVKMGALQDAIFNSANFSSIATDAKGVIQIFNVGAERMLGYSAAEVMNKITPADISDPQEVIARAAELSVELGTPITPGFEALVFKASRGIEDIYELTYIRKDGSRFPAVVSVTALRDAQNAIIGYLLIGTDDTARKQVEADRALLDQRLRDQQFYTRSLIESNIDALVTTDPQGIISDVNQQMVALTGRTRDELIGAPWRKFFTDPVRADTAIKRVLAENRVSNYELTVRALNGEETVVSYNAATIHDRDRKLQGVFAAARDVTERKQAAEKLGRLNADLEQRVIHRTAELAAANMELEAFSYSVAHDLRAPLRSMDGFALVLIEDYGNKLEQEGKDALERIRAASQRMGELIDDMLRLSQVTRAELRVARVDLSAIAREIADGIDREQPGRFVEWVIEPGMSVRADPALMRIAMQNLLQNAWKFTGRTERPVVRVGALTGGANNVYFVADNGVGFDTAHADNLFGAFQRLHHADDFPGTGIGLAIVQRIIRRHDGKIWAEAREGNGATFSFTVRDSEHGSAEQDPPAG